ncbi:MAG TPA: Flp family type IVb pilin [Actinomycetes bacterium]|nr:Flp family type IVb pilin [Actinomycetes bacterium]
MDRAGGERGVTAVAYALMVAIIAVLLVGGVFILGDSIKTAFDHGGTCVAKPSECEDDSGGGNGGGGGGGGTTTTRPASTSTSTTATTGS